MKRNVCDEIFQLKFFQFVPLFYLVVMNAA